MVTVIVMVMDMVTVMVMVTVIVMAMDMVVVMS